MPWIWITNIASHLLRLRANKIHQLLNLVSWTQWLILRVQYTETNRIPISGLFFARNLPQVTLPTTNFLDFFFFITGFAILNILENMRVRREKNLNKLVFFYKKKTNFCSISSPLRAAATGFVNFIWCGVMMYAFLESRKPWNDFTRTSYRSLSVQVTFRFNSSLEWHSLPRNLGWFGLRSPGYQHSFGSVVCH